MARLGEGWKALGSSRKVNDVKSGDRVHHIKGNWDATVVGPSGTDPLSVRVISDGGYKGEYEQSEFEKHKEERKGLGKVRARHSSMEGAIMSPPDCMTGLVCIEWSNGQKGWLYQDQVEFLGWYNKKGELIK